MAWEAIDEVEKIHDERPGKKRHRTWWILLAVVATAVLIGSVVYFIKNWPFTEASVVNQLGTATSSAVHITAFKHIFLPRPGCIAEGVTFDRGSDSDRAKMTVQKLTIESSFSGLLAKHLAVIRLEGAAVLLPAFGTAPSWKATSSDIIIDELRANDAVLEFARHDSKSPNVTFAVHEFVGHHLAFRDPMLFDLRLKNPTPPGEIVAHGSFGPWNTEQLGATPVSGEYSFRNADLGVFGGIQGILASEGQFQGTLDKIAVKGNTTTPDFLVKDSAHKLALETMFDASVATANGDVALNQVQARLLRTIIMTHGSVVGRPGEKGKTASLEMSVRGGRIQDLLLLFVSEKRAPLNGTVSLKAKTSVPPGQKPFLKKLRLSGDFGIDSALFTKEETQKDLGKLSAAGRGQPDQTDDSEDIVSELQGHVDVKDGIATFSDLRFHVPGARARLQGTFNLIDQKVDFRGLLFMDANLPKATSGIKSFLLKAVDPFLKKNRHGGARIPVSITGTYQHPSYKSDPV
jgi:AsmA-like protein